MRSRSASQQAVHSGQQTGQPGARLEYFSSCGDQSIAVNGTGDIERAGPGQY